MFRSVVYVVVIIGCLFPILEAYNILFMLPFGSKSHKNVFDPVAEELGKRGHKVTLFSNIEDKKEVPGVLNYECEGLKLIFEKHNLSFFHGTANSISMLSSMFDLVYEMIDLTYSDPLIGDILKEPRDLASGKPKYDLLVMDACFNDFVLPLAHHMKIPTIIFSPAGTFIHHAWNLNVPFPFAVLPSPTLDIPEPMSFGHRALNSFACFTFIMILNTILLPKEDAVVRKYLPDAPPILQLEQNASFMISNSHPPISLRKPNMPYALEIGGLNCHPAKPLPKDLEDFMQDAGKHGVIYFSLGSVTKGETMPLEMRNKIIEVFAQLPQKILWKYEKEIPSLPKNIKLIKWAPQQDLLGHPQMRLFITHGGGLSTAEAGYHGCCLLGFPLSADQEGNMAQAKRQGIADYLSWETFTSKELLETINRMINDSSCKEKVLITSKLLKDRLVNPVEEAAYWIEYVIRHDGAPFLKSSAGNLNFFQYFLLDVIAVVVIVLALLFTIVFCILRCSVKFFCKKVGINCPCLTSCAKSGNSKKNNSPKAKKTN